MDKALLEKAAQCKSAEEVKALAAEAGMDLTEEQAAELYAKVNGATPLTDEELETVAGGSCDGSEDDIYICNQSGASFRSGDGVTKAGLCYVHGSDMPAGESHYFCCDACFETYKSIHDEYTKWV